MREVGLCGCQWGASKPSTAHTVPLDLFVRPIRGRQNKRIEAIIAVLVQYHPSELFVDQTKIKLGDMSCRISTIIECRECECCSRWRRNQR